MALGALLWYGLSYALPPNMLWHRRCAQACFSCLVPRLLGSMFHDEVAVGAFLAFSGVLGASWLLFIVGDFNECFHGGF